MATKKTKIGNDNGSTAAKRTVPKAKRATAGPASIAPRLKSSHGGPKKSLPTMTERKPARPKRKTELVSATVKEPLTRKAPVRKAQPRKATILAEPSDQARQTAISLAIAGIEKKAIGIEILDVSGRVDYADYIVIMTGRSDRHVHAIATGLEEEMRKKKMYPLSTEGLEAAQWVLIDFGDVVVHVFQEETRAVYDIEGLWLDASRLQVPGVPQMKTGNTFSFDA